jgi:hypothetical protein
MPRTNTSTLDIFRVRATQQRPPCEEVWHPWSVLIPRRSITDRLVWGTVLRRRDDGRWIYRKFIDGVDGTDRSALAQWLDSGRRQ